MIYFSKLMDTSLCRVMSKHDTMRYPLILKINHNISIYISFSTNFLRLSLIETYISVVNLFLRILIIMFFLGWYESCSVGRCFSSSSDVRVSFCRHSAGMFAFGWNRKCLSNSWRRRKIILSKACIVFPSNIVCCLLLIGDLDKNSNFKTNKKFNTNAIHFNAMLTP